MISDELTSFSYRPFKSSLIRRLQAKTPLLRSYRNYHHSPASLQQTDVPNRDPGCHHPSGRNTGREPPPEYPSTCSFPDGVKVLHDCPDATFDVCFVHGLSGNRDRTWTAKGKTKHWPETLLLPRLGSARVLTYGYDAYLVRKPVASTNGLADFAINLLNDLSIERASSNASSRPLVFVAHSLSGLVCKEAILLSRNNPELHLRGLFEYIRGILFLGTPHKGSWIADWARIPASVLGIVRCANKSLLRILETDDKYLQSIQDRFWSMVREQQKSGRDLEITCFFEELPLSRVGKVVSRDSATFEGHKAISIHANHSDMVNFSSEDDNGFKRLLGELVRWESQIISGSDAKRASPPMEEARVGKVPYSPFNNFGPGDQINTHGGTVNKSSGNGSHFPGATFSGPVPFGQGGF
ncbi:P-loop containing protein [Fusarium denticulatum]|uniref:P-loop containing protein n=1 Tax=Fusarium denticulatum TaxID=48507 RepID=A0A8H5T341_9HYPO|nr:P-loop containing protein [Fusarium denticulatum]